MFIRFPLIQNKHRSYPSAKSGFKYVFIRKSLLKWKAKTGHISYNPGRNCDMQIQKRPSHDFLAEPFISGPTGLSESDICNGKRPAEMLA